MGGKICGVFILLIGIENYVQDTHSVGLGCRVSFSAGTDTVEHCDGQQSTRFGHVEHNPWISCHNKKIKFTSKYE